MEKFYTTRLTGQPDHPTLYTPEVPVYLASEVDARIAEMEAALREVDEYMDDAPTVRAIIRKALSL